MEEEETYPPLPATETPTAQTPAENGRKVGGKRKKPYTKRRVFTNEQRAELIKRVDVLMAQGMDQQEACPKVGITTSLYYRWRKMITGIPGPGAGKAMGSRRRKYSDEKRIKLLAQADRMKAKGATNREIGKALKMDPNNLHRWRRELEAAPPTRTTKGAAIGNLRPAPEPVSTSLVDRMTELEAQLHALQSFVGMT